MASDLTRRCGLSERVSFRHGSALALPFAPESFDAATMIHVGMNIADKAGAFAEARRVLRKGALFGVYDVMLVGEAPIPYPMPWAATAQTSFVEPPQAYRDGLRTAGFDILAEHDRSAMTLALAREMRENAERNGAPPLGAHAVMGPATRERLGNAMHALAQGMVAPVEMIAVAR